MVNQENYSIVTEKEGVTGTLYFCQQEGTACTEIKTVGYYVVDKNLVFTCEDKGSGVICSKGSVSHIACESEATSIGKLFLKEAESTTVSICLNSDTGGAVELNGQANGDYLISKNNDPTVDVFGITGNNEKYAIVTIKDKMVTLNATYKNNLKYVYALKESSKIMKKGDKCPANADNTGIDKTKIKEVFCTGGKCKEADFEIKLDTTKVNDGKMCFIFIL